MEYYLFLDDERQIRTIYPQIENLDNWLIVRSYDEFVNCIQKNGLPVFFSADHDLADEHYKEGQKSGFKNFDYTKVKEKTGLDCAKWLIDYCIENRKKLPQWSVHSFNPCGRENIAALLANFEKFQTTPELFDK